MCKGTLLRATLSNETKACWVTPLSMVPQRELTVQGSKLSPLVIITAGDGGAQEYAN